jgi:hypothetical protein
MVLRSAFWMPLTVKSATRPNHREPVHRRSDAVQIGRHELYYFLANAVCSYAIADLKMDRTCANPICSTLWIFTSVLKRLGPMPRVIYLKQPTTQHLGYMRPAVNLSDPEPKSALRRRVSSQHPLPNGPGDGVESMYVRAFAAGNRAWRATTGPRPTRTLDTWRPYLTPWRTRRV